MNRTGISTRGRLAIALGVVVVILGLLIGTAISKASTYYLSVGQVLSKGQSAVGAPETVSGVLVKNSVNYNASTQELYFSVADSTSPSKQATSSALSVAFHGPEPDDFNYGWPVIVTGTMEAGGSFNASKLLVKCPSKYQAQSKTYAALP